MPHTLVSLKVQGSLRHPACVNEMVPPHYPWRRKIDVFRETEGMFRVSMCTHCIFTQICDFMIRISPACGDYGKRLTGMDERESNSRLGAAILLMRKSRKDVTWRPLPCRAGGQRAARLTELQDPMYGLNPASGFGAAAVAQPFVAAGESPCDTLTTAQLCASAPRSCRRRGMMRPNRRLTLPFGTPSRAGATCPAGSDETAANHASHLPETRTGGELPRGLT